MDRKYKILFFTLLLGYLAGLIVFAFMRHADGDEGFYWASAMLVGQGLELYSDFFFMQLPMMPTIFSPFANAGWDSFYVLRAFSVAAGFVSALLFAAISLKLTRNMKSTLIALVLYVLLGYHLSVHSVFKALPFCHLFALAALYFWINFNDSDKTIYLVLSALSMAALINFRYIFIPLLPIYLISFYLISNRDKLRSSAIYLISLLPFSLFTLLIYLKSPDNFIFGNLFFHLNRHPDSSLMSVIQNKIDTVARMMIDPQMAIIFVASVISVYLLYKGGKLKNIRSLFTTGPGMILLNLVIISTAYMIPNPVIRQYSEQYLVFAILLIAIGLEPMLNLLKNKYKRLPVSAVVGGILLIYGIGMTPYLHNFVLSSRDFEARYQLSEIKNVTDYIESQTSPSDTLLSEWPAFNCIAGTTPLPFSEIYGYEYSTLPIEHDEFIKYKLCDGDYLDSMVRSMVPKLVVTVKKTPEYLESALGENYNLAFTNLDVSVYKRK